MARKAGGADQLEWAQGLLRTAKTADELRVAQAVVLPLGLGLSLRLVPGLFVIFVYILLMGTLLLDKS
ncbi:MAG: hypothetical protein ABI865_09510 [Nitrosospira sp.]